jgi:DNA-binding transcriptional ArsR family regulator
MSKRSPSTGRERLAAYERVFGALAHASRRHILLVLRMRGGSMTSGEIAERFSCSWPTTTRHLRHLEDAGLVRVEKRGRERVYHLDVDVLRGVTKAWLGWFEPKREQERGRKQEPVSPASKSKN